MNCARTRQLLDAWVDDEVDLATANEIAGHVRQCPACAALRSERMALRDAVRAALPREPAPAALAASVRRALGRESGAFRERRRGPSWRQAAAIASAAAFASAFAVFLALRAPVLEAPPAQAVASHVAAMVAAGGRAEGLVQVAASDRHEVKPWFHGKVDFAPPVADLDPQGFALVGGRLDRIGDRPAAVIVYRIRNHPIDVFVWRAQSDGAAPVRMAVERGFSVATWARQGLRFAAVSDVDGRDLERLALAMQSLP